MSHDTPHDSLFRFTFSRSEQALDHFRAHLPPAVVEAVRWETLTLQPGSFVDEDLQQLHSDILYRVVLQGTEPRELFLYVLLEHQSQPDRLMPFRLLRYMVRIWERALSQQGHRLPLPFIVPMVLYHGEARWTVPLDFHGLFPDSLLPEHSAPLLAHVPQFRYDLQDLSVQDDAVLLFSLPSPFGCTRALGCSAVQGEALRRLVLLFLKHARERDFWEQFPAWLDALVAVAQRPPDGLAALEALWRYLQDVAPRELPEGVRASLADKLPPEAQRWIVTWRQIVEDRARQQGLEQGQRLQMLRLLRLKFGEPSAEVTARVEGASAEELDAWTERILGADSLEAPIPEVALQGSV